MSREHSVSSVIALPDGPVLLGFSQLGTCEGVPEARDIGDPRRGSVSAKGLRGCDSLVAA